MKDICWMSILELSKAIYDGKLSPVKVVEAIVNQVKKVNPELNAIVTLNNNVFREAEEAEKAVEKGEVKPLPGIPLTIKDNIQTKGIRTTYGSKLFEHYIPSEDAIVVERLKNAGAIILGKTNLPEFGLIAITDNPLFGVTKNPWDKTRTPGGSSGGSAVAVATGMGPASIGNDGGGSIRIPAAFCGVYGFKPSTGRVPSYPSLPIFQGLHTDGVLSRTVEDAALIMNIIAGPDDRDRLSLNFREKPDFLKNLDKSVEGKKFAFSSDLGYAIVEPEVKEVVEKAAFSLCKAGCDVEEVKISLPKIDEELIIKVVSETLTFMEVEDMLDRWKNCAYPAYLSFLQYGESISVKDYVKVEVKRNQLWNKIRKIFKKYDFLLTPTTAIPPFKIEEGLGPTKINGRNVGFIDWMPFTYPFNFTGQPAASIPCGFTKEGLPVGLQIVGRYGDDLGVLQASKAFEKISPWQDKKPSI
ncbi:amidase [Candidatus Bathyarchaeota archaeon]|nr:MAG: amidase [Candidatus Bathyarchaeota archaeon]